MTVWAYEARKKTLSIKHNLYAHTDSVTCLATSPAYNVVVSGSRDGTAVIWDLSRGVFVRQLRGHAGPVAAVAVNDLTVSTDLLATIVKLLILQLQKIPSKKI